MNRPSRRQSSLRIPVEPGALLLPWYTCSYSSPFFTTPALVIVCLSHTPVFLSHVQAMYTVFRSSRRVNKVAADTCFSRKFFVKWHFCAARSRHLARQSLIASQLHARHMQQAAISLWRRSARLAATTQAFAKRRACQRAVSAWGLVLKANRAKVISWFIVCSDVIVLLMFVVLHSRVRTHTQARVAGSASHLPHAHDDPEHGTREGCVAAHPTSYRGL
jgi:hypothetical protein